MNVIIKKLKSIWRWLPGSREIFKAYEKRKSFSHSEYPKVKENEFHKVISPDEYKKGTIDLIEKLNFVYFFEVGDKKIIIDQDWNISDFMKELKSNLTNKEYSTYGKEVIIKFEFKKSQLFRNYKRSKIKFWH
jgi:hypothetical protein